MKIRVRGIFSELVTIVKKKREYWFYLGMSLPAGQDEIM